ncbi:MAG: VanW family protein [Clostridiales bacterium]|nr:VanW family protein [Clostridiales bacterium]
MNKKIGKLLLRILLVLVLVGVATGSVMGFMSYSEYMDMQATVDEASIYKNIRINGVDVGGLSKADALAKVIAAFQPGLEAKTITVKGGGKEYIYKFDEFNPRLDFTKAVEEAYAYARQGSLQERYSKIIALENTPHDITYEPPYSYDSSAVQDKVGLIAEQVHVDPKDAAIDRDNGVFIITKEESGAEMNVKATSDKVNELLAANSPGTVDVVLDEIPPRYTEEDVSKAQSLIGSFSTRFSPGANGRNINITNAASKVNNKTLQPGEIFSTNEALGPSTAENGYAPAPVIINGKLEDDLGGGVCQVSSTLYNAVLYAELEVVERTNHSLKVGYLDYAYDATLAGDYLDLKFKNNTEFPIFLECYIEGTKLAVNIYGYEAHDPSRSLKFFNEYVETVKPGSEKITYDPSMPLGTRVVEKAPRDGVIYNLYKTVYQDGAEASTEKVNSSYYRAVAAEVRVGSGPAYVVPETPSEAPQQMQTEAPAQTLAPAREPETVAPPSEPAPISEPEPAPIPEPEPAPIPEPEPASVPEPEPSYEEPPVYDSGAPSSDSSGQDAPVIDEVPVE